MDPLHPSRNPSVSRSYKYDVFVSFGAEDAVRNFTHHLVEALLKAEFQTFRGDHELEVGGVDIEPELLKAIYESRMSVIVLSENYVSSGWCLDELVMILECRRTSGHIVLPIFYNVDPSAVRRQTGSIAISLARHEKHQSPSKINGWRAALKNVAELAGMVLQNEMYEPDFIFKIVRVIENRLRARIRSFSTPFFVGIHSRAEKINLWLQDGSDDVGVHVIYGMRGVGKTTIADYVYNLHSQRFEGSSFLANMREIAQKPGGFVHLQKKLLYDILKGGRPTIQSVSDGMSKIKGLLHSKRVLIVLDDVDHIDQLNLILGLRTSLGAGSKIIITTSNVGLIKSQPDTQCHLVETLDYNESLELFSLHAFGQDHPFERYMEFSRRIVAHCGGLPLALKVVSSSLSGKNIEIWESELRKLEFIPSGKIMRVLRITYESLQDSHDRDLFLHIACFFTGRSTDSIVSILDTCGFFTTIGLENLIDRCLLSIDENKKVCMHPMIRHMGREIVRLESSKPQNRSRLWHYNDSLEVLTRKNGTNTIEGLALNMHKKKKVVLQTNAFRGMDKLHLLQLSYVQLNGSYEEFPRRLSWLCWLGYSSDCLPTNISLESLVVLEMQYSSLKHVWKGIKNLPSLKVLDVSHSHDLVEVVGDFSLVCNLERLILKDCRSLVSIHESIGLLKKLVYLNMEDCKSIQKFPSKMPICLETIIVHGCSNLCEFTVIQTRRMKLLNQFDVDEAQVKGLFAGAAKSGLSFSNYTGFPKSLKFRVHLEPALLRENKMFMQLIRSRYHEIIAALCHKHTPSTPKCLPKCLPDLFHAERERLPERLEIVGEGSTIMKGDNVDLDDTKTLTPSLKQLLFLYCSLFPLDYEFRKYEMVQLWIAQGFIGETKMETMEDTGLSYFTAMEVEGYFVPSKHDFLLDFDSLYSVPIYNPSNFLYKVNATKISVLDKRNDGGNYFQAVNVDQLCEASELLTKHLSLKISENNDDMTFGVVQKFKNLQTLLLFCASVSTIKHVPRDLFLSLHELRTLNLSRALISGLPSSIGEARELRYLDVSYTPITQLPESVSSLHQLQTLKLRGCVHFSMLPRTTKNLTNLRHIELDIILQLDSMPTYMGNLTKLQTLSAFLVGTDVGCHINELTNLNDLKGALSISGLENVVNKKEAEEAALMNKKYLQRLDLRWSNVIADEENLTVQNKEKRKNIDEEVILESLRPPYGLKELQIEHYAGLVLPTWISDPLFTDLVVITLYRCKNCKLLPCLGQLPGLQSLSIIEMNAVEEINHDFFRNNRVDQSLQAFPKLEMLEVDIMLNLKDWTGVQIGDLPALQKLTVKSCPELVSIPSLSNLKSLKHLEFRRCAKLPSLPNDRLPTSLESFILKDCPQLEKSCINVKGEDWSKICCVPNVWFDDEEIISQGSSQKDSDNVVTPSLHDKIQPAADEELMQCLEILNNMEEIDDDSYSKAVKFFHGEIIWRKVFVHMAEKRRKGFILSL